MLDKWTEDFFAPLAEPASLFGNDVGHLTEQPVVLPTEKISSGWDAAGNCVWCGEAGRCQCNHGAASNPGFGSVPAQKELVRRRTAAKRAHGNWFDSLED